MDTKGKIHLVFLAVQGFFSILFHPSSKCATQYSTIHGTVQVLVTSFLIKTKEPIIQKPPNSTWIYAFLWS